MRRLHIPLLLLFLSLLLSLPAWAFRATVVSVHDGDTVTLDTGQRVRLVAVDAPEMVARGRWGGQPGAESARAYLAALVLGQAVDVREAGQKPSHGRTVADIILPGGVSAAASMVASGWAWAEPRYCRGYCWQLRELESRARGDGLGVWAGEAVPPWEWRKGRE